MSRTFIPAKNIDMNYGGGVTPAGSGILREGDIVCHHNEARVFYEIVKIRWACPPDEGGQADLRFYAASPDVKPRVKDRLLAMDLQTACFGAYLKDLVHPDNATRAIAIAVSDFQAEN